ncbi:SMP-30/gluconolactonase/LRE family protein [Mangrovicoccus ximenensis]|uniref:SMP-30/gluconolactonase/LRE family protein n=1 Tax=Mangrovicoccus ximenensis TaxID=1911570 RepID=UPI000D397800|nr:SMP-30/gluconolactonase/LRE family protein [Mangrovicoccus ximenensis]
MKTPVTIADGFTHTEDARWHDGRFWFVDLYRHRVHSCLEDGSDLRTEVQLDCPPSGLGWLPDGRLLVVAMHHRQIIRREHDGTLAVHADASDFTRWDLNDMVVDAEGRAWVGGHGFDIMGGAPREPVAVLRVDPDGSFRPASDPLHFPNGSTVIDGTTLVVAESFGQCLSAFDIRPDGTLSARRDWARFGPVAEHDDLHEAMDELAVAPDGISCPDAEGAIWVADFLRPRALRVAEGGAILDEVSTGALNCYACTLGGADGRTLFLCATPADFDPGRRIADPKGEIQAVRVDVPSRDFAPAMA